MNQHDRFFAAQRINLTPREARSFPRSPLIAPRRKQPAGRFRFLAGMVVGAALAFAWDAYANPVQRHIEAYERHMTDISRTPCLDRAQFALSVAKAKQRGMPLTEAMKAVRNAAEKYDASARETSEMIALVLRVWAQPDEPASDGMGWEHVSASRHDRAPTWDEMCQIKDLFWDGEDCVLQFHPPRSKYVNNHPHCLHLWRNPAAEIQMPDPFLVGLL